MSRRRWLWAAAVTLTVGGLVAAATSQQPAATPHYRAGEWAGAGEEVTGWMDIRVQGRTQCWYLGSGAFSADPPGPRIALVLPDTYRAWFPALAESGLSGPSVYISDAGLLAGPEVVRYATDARMVVQDATGAPWLDAALAEWDARCPVADRVVVVQPGSIVLDR